MFNCICIDKRFLKIRALCQRSFSCGKNPGGPSGLNFLSSNWRISRPTNLDQLIICCIGTVLQSCVAKLVLLHTISPNLKTTVFGTARIFLPKKGFGQIATIFKNFYLSSCYTYKCHIYKDTSYIKHIYFMDPFI